jgi:hypothetical protein
MPPAPISNFTAGGNPVVSVDEILIVAVADRRLDVDTVFLTTALGFVLASVAIFLFSLVENSINRVSLQRVSIGEHEELL